QPDKAKKLYMASESFRNDKSALYMNLFYNRMEAMDFDEARAYLKLYAPYTDTARSWYQNRDNLATALSAARDAPRDSVIVLSSILDSWHMAVSPTAPVVAVGDTPMSIWDIDRGVKQRDVGRGGSDRCFSPDGRFVATIADHDGAHVLYVYDAADGTTTLAWPSFNDLTSPCFSPDGTRLALCDATGVVHIFDTAAGKKLSTFQMGILRIGGPMVWTPTNLIVCGQSQSESLTVRDGTDYRLLRTLTGVSWPHALGATFDGRYILCNDNRRTLTVWDTRTWQARSVKAPTGSKKIISHPSKYLVILDNFTGSVGGRNVGLTLFDAESLRFLGDCEGGNHMDAGFSADGSRILTQGGMSIGIRDTQLAVRSEFRSPFATFAGARLDRKSGLLVYRAGERTQFVDVTTGERVRSEKEFWPYLWDESGGTLARAGYTGSAMEAWLLDTTTFGARKAFTTASRFSIDSIGERYVVLYSVYQDDRDARGKCDNPTGKAEVELWDKKTYARVAAFSFPLCTESVRLGLYSPWIGDIAVDERNGIVAVATRWQDGWGTDIVASRNVQRFNLKGEALSPLRFTDEVRGLQYLPDGTLRVRFDDRAAVYRGSERISGYSGTSLDTLALRDGEAILWNDSIVELRGRRLTFPGNLE
ncbi:MAG: WD40 repeat domain-containing protein, partial [Spirochaetales bacterium]|nr:WD40 repeat domain-containing protein [Spirochaetales bacterium]